jgi:hypothetical protein
MLGNFVTANSFCLPILQHIPECDNPMSRIGLIMLSISFIVKLIAGNAYLIVLRIVDFKQMEHDTLELLLVSCLPTFLLCF